MEKSVFGGGWAHGCGIVMELPGGGGGVSGEVWKRMEEYAFEDTIWHVLEINAESLGGEQASGAESHSRQCGEGVHSRRSPAILQSCCPSPPTETLLVMSTRLRWACGFVLRMLPKAVHRDWQVWGQNVEEGNCMERLNIEAGLNPQPCPKDGIGELVSHWWRWWERLQWREDRNCVWGYLVQAGGGERRLFFDAWLEKEVAELVVKMETRGKERWTQCIGNSSYLKLTLHLYS